jgi:antibiotic biosynthesis monooxygenase (ABM) superfamily enzyme
MVIYMQQWDILPDKAGDYAEWADSAVSRLLSVPGVVEFRAFRPVAGDRQAGVTYEFTDLESWARWRSNETVVAVWGEARAYMDNTRTELWGPSPVVPEPIRPGK